MEDYGSEMCDAYYYENLGGQCEKRLQQTGITK